MSVIVSAIASLIIMMNWTPVQSVLILSEDSDLSFKLVDLKDNIACGSDTVFTIDKSVRAVELIAGQIQIAANSNQKIRINIKSIEGCTATIDNVIVK